MSANYSRSTFLAAAGALGAIGIAPRSRVFAATPVSVAYAGSLVTLMERSVGPAFDATGYAFQGEAKGSTALANVIKSGLRTPDVFISADKAAVDSLRGASGNDSAKWYATFAATRMQIAYSDKSKFADDFRAAAAGKLAIPDLLARPGIAIARTDPAQDPKGYRVLLVMNLAEKFYKKPGLASAVLGDQENAKQVLPEESALTRLESGEIDALWAYSLESVSRHLPVVELPTQINLGDPSHANEYASASVSVNGKSYRGAPIVFALTIPTNAKDAAAGAAFVAFFLGPKGTALQSAAGLTKLTPVVTGDRDAIPETLRATFS